MVYNNLFNEKKMEEFISLYEDSLVVSSPDDDPVCSWIEMLNNNELVSEQNNYIAFFSIILEKLLGYKLKDIEYEKNIGEKGRPVEFTFKKGDKEYVVVELKGTKTEDLNKRYNREQSAIEQATNYASVKEETQWAFVSNYNEFRLFNPNYNEKYISFKFKSLTDSEILKKFLLIFSKFSLIDEDIPQTLLKETRIIERELEDEFYQLFSETRLMLIKELEHSSSDIDRIEAIRLAQLILNRYIFICFAEDLKLIPSETTADVLITPIEKKNLFEFTMWDRLNELFRFMDKGNEIRGIGAFNGGLFKENLRNLEIRDFIEDLNFYDDCYKKWKFEEKYEEMNNLLGVYKDKLNPIYKNLLVISSFDFGSELSVNILGHIFENSIGDIEELKDQTQERRKKDGVFYTPEYITDYICRNTIIPYLSQTGKANTVHELISEYETINSLEDLDKKLKEIKIMDPACGSGAFLNKAVDVLFEIHEALHDSMYAYDNSLDQYFDSLESRRQIISDNIYGVDLNEESVEITKLSLFLKLATSGVVKKGFKLPNLDKNIKCGDSLIDDETVANDKSFDWEDEFQEIFNNGGFDIVVGNPPYVRHQRIVNLKQSLEKYFVYNGRADLYVYFFERGLNILKDKGYLSFICSNKFVNSDYGDKLREFLINHSIINYIDYSTENLFKGVSVDTSIITIKKEKPNDNHKIFVDKSYYFEQNILSKDIWSIANPKKLELRDKIKSKGVELKEVIKEINKGLLTGYNKAFVIDTETRKQIINEDSNAADIIKPLIVGKNVKKWNITYENQYILYLPWEFDIEKYPSIKRHMLQYKEGLSKRTEVKNGRINWWVLRRFAPNYYHDFNLPKIIYPEIAENLYATYSEEPYYMNNKCFMITSSELNLKYLSALLSSNVLDYYFRMDGYTLKNNGIVLLKMYIEKLPIPVISDEEQMPFILLVDKILELNKRKTIENVSFNKWLQRTFSIEKLPQKLENYYELTFDEFLEEIKKKKVDVKSRKNLDLLEKEFNESLEIIEPLQREIIETDDKINQLVYELYDLTDEEIQIIKNS